MSKCCTPMPRCIATSRLARSPSHQALANKSSRFIQQLPASNICKTLTPAQLHGLDFQICQLKNRRFSIPSRELTYPTWGEGKSSSKVPAGWGYVTSSEGTFQVQSCFYKCALSLKKASLDEAVRFISNNWTYLTIP